MIEIQAESTSYIYIAEKDGLPPETFIDFTVQKVPTQSLWTSVLSKDMNDFRFVLIRGFVKNRKDMWVYYLHWHDNIDLVALDEKVLRGTYTDEDFIDAVKTDLQTTICPLCNWAGLTLVMPIGDPYIGAPGLEMQKLKRRLSAGGFRKCPNCGADLKQGVVKIFDGP